MNINWSTNSLLHYQCNRNYRYSCNDANKSAMSKKYHKTSALEVKLTVVTALSITAGFCMKLVKESEWAKLLA